MDTGLSNPHSCRTMSKRIKRISGYSLSKRMIKDSLDKHTIREISPIEHNTSKEGRLVDFSRIRVELIDTEAIERIYNSLNIRRGTRVKVLETPNYFLVQYGNKPPILVNRRNGRLYEIEGLGYPKEQVEHQASILLNIWKRQGLVEGMTRRRISLANGGKIRNLEDSQANQEVYIGK